MVKQLVVQDDTWGNNLDHVTLDDSLRLLWVFKLLAYGNAMSSTYKTWQVGVKLVMRKSRQRDLPRRPIITLCKRYSARFGCSNSVVPEGFVEIAKTEQQHRVGVLFLDLTVLPHERCFGGGFHAEIYETLRP